MRKPIFLAGLHLSICFAPALEYRIPAYIGAIGQCYAYLEISSLHTKASWSSCRHYHALWNISLSPLYRLKTRTDARPSKMIGSWPGSSQYANVQTAWALLSSYAKRSLLRPSCPRDSRNHLLLQGVKHALSRFLEMVLLTCTGRADPWVR